MLREGFFGNDEARPSSLSADAGDFLAAFFMGRSWQQAGCLSSRSGNFLKKNLKPPEPCADTSPKDKNPKQ
jgi:hypothetical protein